jgi:hypothetical protein
MFYPTTQAGLESLLNAPSVPTPSRSPFGLSCTPGDLCTDEGGVQWFAPEDGTNLADSHACYHNGEQSSRSTTGLTALFRKKLCCSYFAAFSSCRDERCDPELSGLVRPGQPARRGQAPSLYRVTLPGLGLRKKRILKLWVDHHAFDGHLMRRPVALDLCLN